MKDKKRIKRIILFAIIGGALLCALLLPVSRFGFALLRGDPEAAGAIYGKMSEGSLMKRGAFSLLDSYANRQMARYQAEKIPYEEALNRLTVLAQAEPKVQAIQEALVAAQTARRELSEGDALFAQGAYAQAIPHYRLALQGNAEAAGKLYQAQDAYRNQVLDLAIGLMKDEKYEEAQAALQAGLTVLEGDESFTAALADAQVLFDQKVFSDMSASVTIDAQSPADALAYVAQQRSLAPQDERWAYLEQQLRAQVEAEAYEKAQALRERGAYPAAVAALDEGLALVDSPRLQALKGEIEALISYWICELTPSRDDTGSPRTGAASTVLRDQVQSDNRANLYDHSLSADIGSLTFSLGGGFSAFTGTVAMPFGSSSDYLRQSADLRIYGDGQLLAEFKGMDSQSEPMPFEISVENVNELTLFWTSQGANGWADWGRFATVFDGRLLPAGVQSAGE